MKRSDDGGLSWSKRLPTPANWATSKEVPTLHRVIDPEGTKRLIMWSGLYPARLAVSEDDGSTWSKLEPAGHWGGIVVMGCLEPLRTGKGHYLAMFHDDGRFFASERHVEKPIVFTLYKTLSQDGGLTWGYPEEVYKDSAVHLCEPGLVRSPGGNQIAVLLRENSRTKNSHIFLTFRDRTAKGKVSPTAGDWVGWVGTYDDLVQGREGQYRLRLKNNTKGADCAYPGVELLPDGTFVTTTYGHWARGQQPYILSVRFKLKQLDALLPDSSGN